MVRGPSEEEDSGAVATLGSTGEENSDDESEDDRLVQPGGRCQLGVQKVAARLYQQTAPWKSNVSRERRYELCSSGLLQFVRIEATPGSDQRRAVDFPYHLARPYELAQCNAFVRPSETQLSVNNMATEPASNILKPGKGLPAWVHPKWINIFLPTLTHALFISKQPFQDFRPSSPIFVTTIRRIFGLVYSHTTYDIDKDNILVAEVSRRSLLWPSQLT